MRFVLFYEKFRLDVCFINTPLVASPLVGLKPDKGTGAGLTKWTSIVPVI
jgi:hypothetical protein